jgi:hypothetical protein
MTWNERNEKAAAWVTLLTPLLVAVAAYLWHGWNDSNLAKQARDKEQKAKCAAAEKSDRLSWASMGEMMLARRIDGLGPSLVQQRVPSHRRSMRCWNRDESAHQSNE